MTYIDNNEKLADLLEKLISKEPDLIAVTDAKDLIIELRSPRSEVSLLDRDTLKRKYNNFLSENDQR